MGLFGKIKNILFEDDDEVGEMPVYTKEDVEEVKKVVEEEKIEAPFDPNPIRSTENQHFNNVKRDLDFAFDDKDVLGEVPGAEVALEPEVKPEPVPVPKSEPVPETREEKRSPFLSFDADEFDRLNSRIISNENKIKKEVPKEIKAVPVVSEARRANNNFSSTTTVTEKKVNDPERYKISNSNGGRKPFKPSPVISPVYGILDKNYKKDEIMDKKGGMKREKVVKPIVREEVPKNEETAENVSTVDIDSVRKKAYGGLELLEKNAVSSKVESKAEKKEEIKVVTVPTDTIIDDIQEEIDSKSVEEQLDDKNFEVTNVIDVSEEKEIEQKLESIVPKKEAKSNKPKSLDEMEKTNTLQILDDIEKELNSIKPITKSEELDEEDVQERIQRGDTLENDLFNLIDSMYEKGEEEEDD